MTETQDAKTRPSIFQYLYRRLFGNHYRRHDKLKVWIGLVVTVALPVLLCWSIPNLIAHQRVRAEAAGLAAAEASDESFRIEYAHLIALCGTDQTPAVTRQTPPSPKVLVIQHNTRAAIQASLPQEWQPSSPDDVTAVICLSREASRPVDTCAGGETVDLEVFHGYEITVLAEIGADPNMVLPGECAGKHPELSGELMHRYATDAIAYDVASGEVFATAIFWGDDPPVCMVDLDTATNLDALEMLYGERITDDALVDGLAALFGL